MKKLTKKELNNLLKIAQQNLAAMESREDFERHWCDDEDFFEVSIWGLKACLEAAYTLGKESK